MERKPVKSGALAEVGYDPATETLEVLFPSKALWRYFSFPQDHYDMFMRAESLGRFFAANIRANFISHRVHTDDNTRESGTCTDPKCWCNTQRKDVSHGTVPNPNLEKELKKSIKAAKAKKSA
jgi:hypothetical protein